jgi:peptidoglycan/xylan/chitin deacetylase (PgdA/CDA1 family)
MDYDLMLSKLKYLLRSIILPDRLFLLSKTQQEKTLYLTFDDGPVPGVIERLLDLLDKYQIKVTFFIVGSRAEKNPDLLHEIYKRAHTIANHSYSHPSFDKISHTKKIIEIDKTNLIIKQVTGKPCTLFRAPQGRWDKRLILTLLLKKITAVHWSRDSQDFLKEPANKIAERLLKQPVKSGDIILFHDDNKLCIDALNILIPQWLEQGYCFSALEQEYE